MASRRRRQAAGAERPRVSLTQAAIEQIKDMIVRGDLRPGDKLPVENDLANRLGLSRGSLREAVRALAVMRVLEVRQGDGTYVTSLEPELLLQSIGFFTELNRESTLVQILDARRMLEAGAVALAAHLATPEELATLERLVDAMPACESIEAFVDNDMEFHRVIATASRNDVVVALLDNLSSRTTRARVWRGITETGANERTVEEHRAIYEALAAHRGDIAAALVTAHIANVESWLQHATGDPAFSVDEG
jgi:GntR family transcriptional regulator, transcriptional repressor for pyruvate dehydrogenase complex